MKTLKSSLPRAAVCVLIFTVLCGVVYTGIVTGIAQIFFHDNANGSIIEVDGKNTEVNCWGNSIRMTAICGDVS